MNLFFKSVKAKSFLKLLFCIVFLLSVLNYSHATPLYFEISGDVENVLKVDSDMLLKNEFIGQATQDQIDEVPLQPLLDLAMPITSDYEILFLAKDGFSNLISNSFDSMVSLSADSGWQVINRSHPASANIKNLEKIIVISVHPQLNHGVSIISKDNDIAPITAGNAYKLGYNVVPTKRGTASVVLDDKTLSVTSFNRHKEIDISLFAPGIDLNQSYVYTREGRIIKHEQNNRLIINRNRIAYKLDNRVISPQVVGIALHPDGAFITDVFHDAVRLIKSGEPVLIILVDGLGMHQFKHAESNGHANFLSSLPTPKTALVTYPPITPVNLASSLTGKVPFEHGVTERRVRRSSVPTLFAWCRENNHPAIAIIGPVSAIAFEIDAIMVTDTNNNGTTDDEKVAHAITAIDKSPELLFVHLKNIDTIGHKHGDLSPETMQAISDADAQISEIVKHWEGHLIIYADHGMHSSDSGGYHGKFTFRDMFVPYWLLDKEQIR